MQRADVGRLGVEEEVGVEQTQWPLCASCLGDWLQDCELSYGGHLHSFPKSAVQSAGAWDVRQRHLQHLTCA